MRYAQIFVDLLTQRTLTTAEMLGLGACVLCLFSAAVFRGEPGRIAVTGFALAATALITWQFASGDWSWEMMPSLAGAALLLIARLYGEGIDQRIPLLAAGVLVCVSIFYAAVKYPVFEFEKLTGEYPVGTTSVHLVDQNRRETFSSDPKARRELMLQVWYPREKSQDQPIARYRPHEETDLQTRRLSLVRTRSVLNAPVLNGRYRFPLVLFSPAANGLRTQNTYQMEEIASHGFVVVGMDHSYGSSYVRFPDGRVIKGFPNNFLDFSSEQALRDSTASVERDLEARVKDAMFVLDTLLQWNVSDPSGRFTRKLDTAAAAIIGHSFGGAVAAEACVRDRRFRAGINMDGWMFGLARKCEISQPFFYMVDNTPYPQAGKKAVTISERLLDEAIKDGYDTIERKLSASGGYFLAAEGLQHMNFADRPLFSLLHRETAAGTIERRLAHRLINAYTMAFLKQHLKGEPQSLLDRAPVDPGVTYTHRNRTS